MKPMQRKSFFREIKSSLNRYLSILFMVALGVAFYTGVRSSEPDMRLSADAYYDQVNFFDVRVLGSYGMTEGDVEQIRKLNGVSEAEGAYMGEALWKTEDKEYVCTLYSLTEKANQPVVNEGRLPRSPEECFLDASINMGREKPIQIGDRITLSSGTEDPLSDTLAQDTYTVVGIGYYPYYLSWDRGSAKIGDGTADCFLLLPKEAFSQEAYSAVYVTADSLDSFNSFSEEYKEKLGKIKARIEAIAAGRCEVRYQEIFDGANEQIEEAKQALEEGKTKADTELADALTLLTDGEEQLEKGKTELLEKEAELIEGKKTLKESEKTIAQSEKELNAKKEELLEGELELMRGWSAYDSARAQYDTMMQTLELLKPLQDYWDNVDLGHLGGEALEEALRAIEEINQRVEELEGKLDGMEAQLDEAYATLGEKQRELSEGKILLASAQAQLEIGKAQLESSKIQIEEGEIQIEEAKVTLQESEKQLSEAREAYETGKAEAEKQIADAQKQIADGEKELAKLTTPEWYVLDRETVQTYVEYGMDAERIGAIGKIFPAIFFLVAALVSLTTMTRMVEDDRTQIGTMKALGYDRGSIAARYLLYALSASLFGSILGVFVGGKLLPYIIMTAYGILYTNLTVKLIPIQWDLAVIASLIAVVCTVAATFFACYKELLSTPAALMRPAAPKQGKRVFLENITVLWKRLNFSWKATVRNLLRYKKRFFMTVFGIGGCMALLMVGFGLRDSIREIVNKQYTTVWTYDASITLSDDACDNPELERDIRNLENITDSLPVYLASMDVEGEDGVRTAYLFVPESLEDLGKFASLQERVGGKRLSLSENGAIISEKLARLLGVSVGDEVTLKEGESQRYSVTVEAIMENYLYHYVFISPALYEQLYGKAPQYNQFFIQMQDTSPKAEAALGQALLEKEEISGVSFVSVLQAKVSDMMRSLDLIVWVLIVSAGLLAFVVLYNLNNINISERQREMATLKVLGFYDMEVASYVYRENVLLTVIGTLAGVFMGIALHQFVIRTCEIDMLMFGRLIQPLSYLFSVILTFLFSAVVNFAMYYKLKKIDMIESLKSVE